MYKNTDEYIKMLYKNFKKRVKYADLPDKPNISVDTSFDGEYHFSDVVSSSIGDCRAANYFTNFGGSFVCSIPYSILSSSIKHEMYTNSSKKTLGGSSRYVKIIHVDSGSFSISGRVISDESIRSYFIGVNNSYSRFKVFASNLTTYGSNDANNYLLPYLVKIGSYSYDIYIDMVDPRWSLSSFFKYQVSSSMDTSIDIKPITDTSTSSLPSGAIKATIASYIP